MQVETAGTSPEPITASNPQDTKKNGWTCVDWDNTVFEIAARKTSGILSMWLQVSSQYSPLSFQ